MKVSCQGTFGISAGDNRHHDALFTSAAVPDLQRLVELIPCGVRFWQADLVADRLESVLSVPERSPDGS